MTAPRRLPAGGRIDRSKPISFSFDGETIPAFRGDTLASALIADGRHLVGRSFKYHRPRGILTHGSDEPCALVAVDRGPGRVDPNNRVSVIEATNGLKAASQNRWPSLAFDVGAINDLLSPLFVAGFYNKTFMWPKSFWTKVYEPIIRAAAGLGRAPTAPDPDRYANRHAHFDVLVVGAGPAGLATALAASRSGKRVAIADEQYEFGGTLLHDLTSEIDGKPAAQWLAEAVAELAAAPNVTCLPRTTVFGYYNHNHVVSVERVADHLDAPDGRVRERLWQMRVGEVVLATGSFERPLVFADNDRPGIMLAESVRAFVNRWAALPGHRAVFVTTGASAYRAALDTAAAGVAVTIVDLRAAEIAGPERAEALAAGIEVLSGHTVIRAEGRARVSALVVAAVDATGLVVGPHRLVPCDCVGMSGGWTPSVHLFSQSRGKLVFDAAIDCFVPGTSVQKERSAGACRASFDLARCLAEGWAAGAEAAGVTETRSFTATPTPTGFVPVRVLPTDENPVKVRAFVDFQGDVTAKDIRLAVREGFHSIEHVKRYTTTGMASDQGKTSNMNALGLVAELLDREIPAVGTTTFRPPFTPVSFGALVNINRHALFEPTRRTPIHDWAAERGAIFEPVGQWLRAQAFPAAGEDMHAAVARECRAVREGVGLFDASTLGKIEVVGPDAAEFLNRLYINAFARLEPGRCRYGLMLKEDGFVMDDGVVGRLAADRFHVTTTTGGAARVLAHMEDYLQTEWPDLRVHLTSTTEQWAVIAVQGPKARAVLEGLVEGIDLSPAAMPHMSVREGRICGVPTRLFRVSFTGELGFEINVPADHGPAVWEAVHAAGAAHGIVPYGTEAMHVLRAEKGYLVVGQDTDGTMTPDDVGYAGMIAKAKPDFVGKRSLVRPDMLVPDRRQFVGLLPVDPRQVLVEGAQIVETPSQPIPMKMIGHVTSSYASAVLGRSIALAVVAGGRARIGETVWISTDAGGFTRAVIASPVFFDAKGERLDG
jgi:sarcosine oxidase subunit alpha